MSLVTRFDPPAPYREVVCGHCGAAWDSAKGNPIGTCLACAEDMCPSCEQATCNCGLMVHRRCIPEDPRIAELEQSIRTFLHAVDHGYLDVRIGPSNDRWESEYVKQLREALKR